PAFPGWNVAGRRRGRPPPWPLAGAGGGVVLWSNVPSSHQLSEALSEAPRSARAARALSGRAGGTNSSVAMAFPGLTKGRSKMLARIARPVVNFLQDESGPTAVEYAVMLALIIVVCITAITTLGTNANNTFSYVGGKIGS